MRRGRVFSSWMRVSLAAWFLLGSSLAFAQPARGSDEEARLHFQSGTSYYRDGRFADAAREFERAYELSQRPQLLHNIYLARRDLGDTVGSADALRRYLATSTEIPADQRTLLEHRLAALDEQIAAAADGGGESTTGADDSSGMGILPGVIVTSAGGAILLVGIVQGLRANSARSDYDALCAESGVAGACSASDETALDSLADDFDRRRNSSLGLLIGGSVTAAVGSVLLVLGAKGHDDAPTADLACSAFGCVATLRGRF